MTVPATLDWPPGLPVRNHYHDRRTRLQPRHGRLKLQTRTPNNHAVTPIAHYVVNASIRFLLVYNFASQQIESAVSDITRALQAERIHALPSTVLPLEDIAAAHNLVDKAAFGRVLLDIRG